MHAFEPGINTYWLFTPFAEEDFLSLPWGHSRETRELCSFSGKGIVPFTPSHLGMSARNLNGGRLTNPRGGRGQQRLRPRESKLIVRTGDS